MYVPKPRRQKDGIWSVRVRVNGQTVIVKGGTENSCLREAQRVKAGLLTEKRSAIGTLGYIVDRYLKEYGPVLSPSSMRGFRSIRKNRFLRYMEMDIGRIDWQKMISDETREVSPKTVKCAWGLVRRSLKVIANISPEVRLPQVPVKELPFLQPEEIPLFLDALKGNIAEVPALLELHGLRRSEMMALQYSDIRGGVIHIHGAVVQNEDGKFVRKETNKNRASTRNVPIFIPRLAELCKGKTGPVMTIGTNTLYSNIKRCCEKAGVTVLGNHGLRRSMASLGWHLGLNERQLMQLGGWSDFGTMHRTYIRLAQTDKSEAAEKFKNFFCT